MTRYYLGCDPGKTGYMALLNESGEVVMLSGFPMIGNDYDLQKLSDIFGSLVELYNIPGSTSLHVILEDVKSLQKPYDSGNWSLSRSKTILEMCCVFHKLPFIMVHSKTWQKEIWQGIPKMKKSDGTGDSKSMTLLAIKRLFPDQDLREYKEPKFYADTSENRKLGRAGKEIPRKDTKPHDGLVDALAIAEYGRRKF